MILMAICYYLSSPALPKRCTPPFGLHLRSHASAPQRNSLHSQPVAYCQHRPRIAFALILPPPAFAGPPSQRLLALKPLFFQ